MLLVNIPSKPQPPPRVMRLLREDPALGEEGRQLGHERERPEEEDQPEHDPEDRQGRCRDLGEPEPVPAVERQGQVLAGAVIRPLQHRRRDPRRVEGVIRLAGRRCGLPRGRDRMGAVDQVHPHGLPLRSRQPAGGVDRAGLQEERIGGLDDPLLPFPPAVVDVLADDRVSRRYPPRLLRAVGELNPSQDLHRLRPRVGGEDAPVLLEVRSVEVGMVRLEQHALEARRGQVRGQDRDQRGQDEERDQHPAAATVLQTLLQRRSHTPRRRDHCVTA